MIATVATVRISTLLAAGPRRCFDCARDIDLHRRSLAASGERAVAGVTRGLIGPGERVTFRGRHFGWIWEHTAEITRFAPPRHFQDRQIRGAFRSFVHDHYFRPVADGTWMVDVVAFAAPWPPLGPVLDRVLLAGHLRRLLRQRALAIREAVALT